VQVADELKQVRNGSSKKRDERKDAGNKKVKNAPLKNHMGCGTPSYFRASILVNAKSSNRCAPRHFGDKIEAINVQYF
jgi:hypothetical protein